MKRSRRSRRALGGLLDTTSLTTVAVATGGVVALAAWFLLRPKAAEALPLRRGSAFATPKILIPRLRLPPELLRRGQPAPAVATSQPSVGDSVPVTAGGATVPLSPSDAVSKADPCFGLTGQAGLDCRSDKALAELDSMTR